MVLLNSKTMIKTKFLGLELSGDIQFNKANNLATQKCWIIELHHAGSTVAAF